MRPENDQILRDSPNNRCDLKILTSEKLTCLDASNHQGSIFVFRDDLLNPPFAGSKHRKYQGLFAHLLNITPSLLIIPGSMASNHFVTAIYLAKQNKIPLLAITKKPFGNLRPNAIAALKMLDESEVLFTHDPFDAALKMHEHTPGSFLMPLGGFCAKAAISSLSLGYEIMEYHQIIKFDHIFIDAGTGLQAASCLLALEEASYEGKVTIVKMGTLDFDQVLNQVQTWTGLKKPRFEYSAIDPFCIKGYAKTNKQLETFRNEFFEKTSIPLDVTYNAKLFYTALEIIKTLNMSQNYLIVHSGGTYAGVISE